MTPPGIGVMRPGSKGIRYYKVPRMYNVGMNSILEGRPIQFHSAIYSAAARVAVKW